jgi:signal transduction histidine kinase
MARRSARPQSGHIILLVDDQQDTLQSVGNLLEREGHRVLTAEGGAEALDILKNNDVHLIIVDFFMPRMTGGELVRQIRTFDPYVQIILQTGYAGEKPPRLMLEELDIQGYHDKGEEPDRLLIWVHVGLKTYRLVSALRERERLQQELLNNCSHEFRTPLNVILGYAELMLSGAAGELPPTCDHPLKSIENAGQSLLHLASDFLQYARIDAGAGEITHECLQTAQLTREMARFVNLLVEDKSLSFTLELDEAPPQFLSDGARLRTILRNLLTNAAKFTSEGGITLRVVQRADTLRIDVHDTGAGILPADQERIFDPFRQLDGSSTRQHGGVGLGLALSRREARILGGDLLVHSEPGVGSTFTVLLPASAAEAYAPVQPGGIAAEP